MVEPTRPPASIEPPFSVIEPGTKRPWWELTQEERRRIFEDKSRHIADSLKYLPAIARQLYHCRDLGEPFDFLTWFEFAPEHATEFEELVCMLAEGFTTRRGRHGALLYHDAVNRMLRARPGARLTAITSGGAIPDTADYQVLLEPEGQVIGSVHEDFAVESLAGDVFQLGNMSYRILRVERSVVRVQDARGEAPTIPFWLGEAPGRSDELSSAVSRLREELQPQLEQCPAAVAHWLDATVGIGSIAAEQLTTYKYVVHGNGQTRP